jgi:hypothetical protein
LPSPGCRVSALPQVDFPSISVQAQLLGGAQNALSVGQLNIKSPRRQVESVKYILLDDERRGDCHTLLTSTSASPSDGSWSASEPVGVEVIDNTGPSIRWLAHD